MVFRPIANNVFLVEHAFVAGVCFVGLCRATEGDLRRRRGLDIAGAAVARDACQTMMCTLTRNPPCNAAPGYAFAPAIKAFNAANTDAARPALILDLITHVFEQTGAAFRKQTLTLSPILPSILL